MDPSDIILTPYALERLSLYVTVVFTTFLALASIQTQCIRSIMNLVLEVFYATLLFLGIFVLCGADPTQNILHTLWSALYVATLTWLTPCNNTRKSNIFSAKLSLKLQLQDDILASYQLYGTVLGMIPVQILNILDWGAQVQRWPLPLLVGSTFGWVVGTSVGVIQIRWSEQSRSIHPKN